MASGIAYTIRSDMSIQPTRKEERYGESVVYSGCGTHPEKIASGEYPVGTRIPTLGETKNGQPAEYSESYYPASPSSFQIEVQR